MGRLRRRYRRPADVLDEIELEVERHAEESLVAALQESDTAVEALQDADTDAREGRVSRRWQIGIMGLVLALLGILVARSRR